MPEDISIKNPFEITHNTLTADNKIKMSWEKPTSSLWYREGLLRFLDRVVSFDTDDTSAAPYSVMPILRHPKGPWRTEWAWKDSNLQKIFQGDRISKQKLYSLFCTSKTKAENKAERYEKMKDTILNIEHIVYNVAPVFEEQVKEFSALAQEALYEKTQQSESSASKRNLFAFEKWYWGEFPYKQAIHWQQDVQKFLIEHREDTEVQDHLWKTLAIVFDEVWKKYQPAVDNKIGELEKHRISMRPGSQLSQWADPNYRSSFASEMLSVLKSGVLRSATQVDSLMRRVFHSNKVNLADARLDSLGATDFIIELPKSFLHDNMLLQKKRVWLHPLLGIDVSKIKLGKRNTSRITMPKFKDISDSVLLIQQKGLPNHQYDQIINQTITSLIDASDASAQEKNDLRNALEEHGRLRLPSPSRLRNMSPQLQVAAQEIRKNAIDQLGEIKLQLAAFSRKIEAHHNPDSYMKEACFDSLAQEISEFSPEVLAAFKEMDATETTALDFVAPVLKETVASKAIAEEERARVAVLFDSVRAKYFDMIRSRPDMLQALSEALLDTQANLDLFLNQVDPHLEPSHELLKKLSHARMAYSRNVDPVLRFESILSLLSDPELSEQSKGAVEKFIRGVFVKLDSVKTNRIDFDLLNKDDPFGVDDDPLWDLLPSDVATSLQVAIKKDFKKQYEYAVGIYGVDVAQDIVLVFSLTRYSDIKKAWADKDAELSDKIGPSEIIAGSLLRAILTPTGEMKVVKRTKQKKT